MAAKARTEQELERALERCGVPAGERKSVLARVKELGYLNDREVARGRAAARVERGDAPRMIAKKLSAQGIAAADANEAAQEAAQGRSEADLADLALQRKLRGRKPRDLREKQRLLRALIAKGHRPSQAARALGLVWEGDDEVSDD